MSTLWPVLSRIAQDLTPVISIPSPKSKIDAEPTRLHPIDDESVILWAQRLKNEGALLGFKGVDDPPPAGSGVDHDLFYLMIQTPRQRSLYKKIGGPLICLDGTHNTTHYQKTNLFTILCRDGHGHGESLFLIPI